jgi:hypothetical protein
MSELDVIVIGSGMLGAAAIDSRVYRKFVW